MPLQTWGRRGSLYKSKSRSGARTMGASPFHGTRQPGQRRPPSPSPPPFNAASCHPAPVPVLALNLGILFPPPGRAPGLTSVVTSLPHGEEGAGMRSQGKGGRNSERSWFSSHNADLLKWELGLVLDFASPGRLVISQSPLSLQEGRIPLKMGAGFRLGSAKPEK